jgi:hypothetical protein
MGNQLDIADQDIFLSILVLVSQQKIGFVAPQETTSQIDIELKKLLNLDGFLLKLNFMSIEIKLYNLLKIANKTVSNYKFAEDSLKRLSRCSLYFCTDKYSGSTNLLSFYRDITKNTYFIAINPIVATVFLQGDRYVLHNMNERFQFKTDTTKAIHSYLSRTININEYSIVNIDNIYNSIYSKSSELNKEQLSPKTISNRKSIIKKSLEEIGKHDEFTVEISLNKAYKILRKDVLNLKK